MPAESAVAFGLHPNAEIGFKLREAASFCSNLQLLQVRLQGCAAEAGQGMQVDEGMGNCCINGPRLLTLRLTPSPAAQPREAAEEAGLTVEEQARQVLDSLVDRIPELFDLDDIRSRVDEFTPYVM